MLSYLFKRFVQSVIVVFAVISIVFILQSKGVTDPVDDFVTSSFGELTTTRDAYEKAYIKEAMRQGKDLPIFYLSLSPSYFPDDLHSIIFKEDREYTKDLLRYSKCATCTEEFWNLQSGITTAVALDTTLAEETISIVKRIERERDINKLKVPMGQLEGVNNKAIQRLMTSYKGLSEHSHALALPKIIWHGAHNQYHHYLTNTLRGKLGVSKSDGKSASTKISNALKWTLSMNIVSFLLSAIIGLWIGMWSIKNDGKKFEKGVSSSLLFIYTMPVFWTATMFLVFFTTKRYGNWMDIFPTPGIKYWYADESILRQIWLSASQLILPIICITIPSLAYMSRIMKSKFSEILSSNFVTTLRAKGLSENLIYNRHILRNGLIPYITILTGSIPGLFAGSLVIEKIFNIPGIGKLLLDSIYSSDWPVISGLVIMMSVVTVLSYFIADILYSKVNPKIELTG